jgi:hypothetical protein
MSDPTTDPIVSAVKETCILASIKLSALGLTRTDKNASRKVSEDHSAVAGAAKVVVHRLAGADEHHRAITAAQNQAKQALKRRSMPYGDDDSWRLLPNKQFEPLLADLAHAKKSFDDAKRHLDRAAQDIIDQVRTNIGSLDIPVPTVDELTNAYSMTTEFRPVPDSACFHHLPEAVSRKLTKHLDQRVAAAFEKAQTNTMERLIPPLEHFIERMQKYNEREKIINNGEDPGKHGRFNDTVVGNIKEIFDVLNDFNVVGDERLTELGNQLASLANVEPDTLRKNADVRSAAEVRAREVVAALNGWLTPTQNTQNVQNAQEKAA